MALDNAGNAFVSAWTAAGAFVVKYPAAGGDPLWVKPIHRLAARQALTIRGNLASTSAGDVIHRRQ
jgi:hypothetical protein